MRDQRKMPGEQVEFVELLAPRVEIMIGDDFQKIDALAVGEEIGAKRGTVAEAHAEKILGRNRIHFSRPRRRSRHSRRHLPRRSLHRCRNRRRRRRPNSS